MKTLISVVILSTLFSVCLALPANLNSSELDLSHCVFLVLEYVASHVGRFYLQRAI